MRKLEAFLKIPKFFVLGGGCTCALSLPPFMDEVLREERQLMKWLKIFQVGIARVRIFPGRIFLEPI